MQTYALTHSEALLYLKQRRPIVEPSPPLNRMLGWWGTYSSSRVLPNVPFAGPHRPQYRCLCGACILTFATPPNAMANIEQLTQSCNCQVDEVASCPNVCCEWTLGELRNLYGFNFYTLEWLFLPTSHIIPQLSRLEKAVQYDPMSEDWYAKRVQQGDGSRRGKQEEKVAQLQRLLNQTAASIHANNANNSSLNSPVNAQAHPPATSAPSLATPLHPRNPPAFRLPLGKLADDADNVNPNLSVSMSTTTLSLGLPIRVTSLAGVDPASASSLDASSSGSGLAAMSLGGGSNVVGPAMAGVAAGFAAAVAAAVAAAATESTSAGVGITARGTNPVQRDGRGPARPIRKHWVLYRCQVCGYLLVALPPQSSLMSLISIMNNNPVSPSSLNQVHQVPLPPPRATEDEAHTVAVVANFFNPEPSFMYDCRPRVFCDKAAKIV
eukprot:TRINITY_DN13961_c0_g1_i4.p1 TRINITY_DN13961_c0_g1~~TRINITY_DN13961_c0_g1_i4.p1  ORF type:complete len:438 (+),score=126.40 TRINITY_DN13961_c0_g1_i4:108-1421(+)